MKKQITESFILSYQEELASFIQDSLAIFGERETIIKNIFGGIPDEKIKASFFTDRKSFVEYIQTISGGHEPPGWAIGCFYNGEIQTLINVNNANNLNSQKHTLTHEYVHLCFNEFIYDKYAIDRIRWFDESYAGFIDGTNENIALSKLKDIAKSLKNNQNLDVNILNDIKQVKTKFYNGYDIFLVIGKYIFGNNKEKELVEILKRNPTQIVEMGKSILSLAIGYIESL